jgi:hypothetical protein
MKGHIFWHITQYIPLKVKEIIARTLLPFSGCIKVNQETNMMQVAIRNVFAANLTLVSWTLKMKVRCTSET